MNALRSSAVVIAVAGGMWMLAPAGAATAQTMETTESGDSLYRTYCSSCHGQEARGDGPVAQFLKVPPANLTQIAARNKGVFPAERVHQIIDGRQVPKTHGASQMPVWGDAFAKSTSGGDAAAVTAKIKALVEYLASKQEKPAGKP
jgi:mono/diheme cytochrome c family protein